MKLRKMLSIILLFIIFLIVGCYEETTQPIDPSLYTKYKVGFEYIGGQHGDSRYEFHIGIKTDNLIFDINNFELTLHHGYYWENGFEIYWEVIGYYVGIFDYDSFTQNRDYYGVRTDYLTIEQDMDVIFAKVIGEDLKNHKVERKLIEESKRPTRRIYELIYQFSEKITIPKELFLQRLEQLKKESKDITEEKYYFVIESVPIFLDEYKGEKKYVLHSSGNIITFEYQFLDENTVKIIGNCD